MCFCGTGQEKDHIQLTGTQAASLKAKSDVRIALLTLLMVVCFEAWVGNLDFAVRQIQTGLRFVREWHESSRRFLLERITPEPGLEGEIVRIFSRLDCQIISFSEKPTPEYHAMVIARGRQMMEQMPQVFTNLADASFYEEGIVKRTLAFPWTRSSAGKASAPAAYIPHEWLVGMQEDPKVLATVESMQTYVTRWRAAFEPLWLRVKAANNSADLFSAALLNIGVCVARRSLSFSDCLVIASTVANPSFTRC